MHNIGFALEIILDGPHATLWDHHAKRETLRFLRKRGNDISSQDLSHLVDAILGGPERDEYGQSLSEDEWTAQRNFQIRLRLHKLVEGGAVLPEQAQETYDRIQQAQPWQPEGNGSEEFSFFMSEARWVSEEELQGRGALKTSPTCRSRRSSFGPKTKRPSIKTALGIAAVVGQAILQTIRRRP